MIVAAFGLIAIGGLLSLMNWGTLVASLRRKRFVSAVPLIGALPLGGGLALLPETRAFAWFALVADYGTLVLIICLPRIIYEVWSTSRVNLLHCLTTRASGRIVAVKLYRRQVAVISVNCDPPVPCNDSGARIQSFGLVGKWAPTESGFSIEEYASDRRLLITKVAGAYTTKELNYPGGRTYSYDCLDGLVVREQE